MTTRDLVLVGLFAAFIVVLGMVPAIPTLVPGVPITLQSLGVMLAGTLLGPKRGALAVIVVIALVGIGLPVLSGGRGGLGVYVGPTAGFLFGWIAAAFVAGVVAQMLDQGSRVRRFTGVYIAALIGGVLVLYAAGIAWLALYTGLGWSKAFFGSIAFVPGDALKAAIAALVTVGVTENYPIVRK